MKSEQVFKMFKSSFESINDFQYQLTSILKQMEEKIKIQNENREMLKHVLDELENRINLYGT